MPAELSAATPGYPESEHADVPVFVKRMVPPSWPRAAPDWPSEMDSFAKVQRSRPGALDVVAVGVVVGGAAVVEVLGGWCSLCECGAADGLVPAHALQTSARLPASTTAPTVLVRTART